MLKRPLRISSDPDDPGYALWSRIPEGLCSHIVVLLDDVVQDRVFTACEATGTVIKAAVGDDGEVRLNAAMTEVERVTLTGQVRIVFPNNSERWL